MKIKDFETDIDAVITSFNYGTLILEAVESLCVQTLLPQRIIIVDDGSTDEGSIQILKDIEKKSDLQVPVLIHYQKNRGVSAALRHISCVVIFLTSAGDMMNLCVQGLKTGISF